MKKKVFLSLFTLVLYFLSTAPKIAAKEIDINLSPSVIQIQSRAESIIKVKFLLTNNSDFDLKLRPSLAELQNNKILPYNQASNEYKQLFSQITFEDQDQSGSITLNSQESKEIPIYIKINHNITAQDYTFSVTFATLPEDTPQYTGSYSNFSLELSSIILLSFKVDHSKYLPASHLQTSFIYFHTPLRFSADIANDTSYFHTIQGNITVSDLVGQPIETIALNPFIILPNTQKAILDTQGFSEIKSTGTYPFGIYKASLNLKIDSFDTRLFLYFIVIPVPYIIIISIISFFISGIYLKVKRKMK